MLWVLFGARVSVGFTLVLSLDASRHHLLFCGVGAGDTLDRKSEGAVAIRSKQFGEGRRTSFAC